MSIRALATANARANRSRFALTASAVTLSVAFLTATLILADSLTGTAAEDIAAANAELSFVVEGPIVLEGDGGGPGEAVERITGTLPVDTLDRVAAVDGVDTVEAETIGFAKVVADGRAVGGGTATDVGRSWIASPALNPFELRAGRAPAEADEVALDSALAAAGGAAVGDVVEVLTATGLHEMTVTGLVGFGGADAAPLQRTVLVAPEVAPGLLDEPGHQRLRASVDDGLDPADVIADVAASVPGVQVIEAAAHIDVEQRAVASPFEFLSLFLLAFAAIATIAGTTIIVNTFSIAIAQRRRELALLRAVGATRREVLGSILGEATIVAVVATAAGLGLGLLGASTLRSVMDLAGLSFLDGPLVVTPVSLAIATGVGLLVTVGSAVVPARAAAGAAPVEALRAASTEPAAVSLGRSVGGLLAVAAGGAALVAGVASSSAALLAGGALLVPGLLLAGPALVTGVAAVARPLLAPLAGVEGAMAATNLARNPRRASATALGLTLGVAMVGFFTVMAGSLNAGVARSIDRSLQADVVVTSVSTEVATIEPGLIDRVATIDGVTSAAALTTAEAAVGGADGVTGSAVVGGIGDDLETLFDFGVATGSLDDLADGGVAVWTGVGEPVPALGETIELTFEDRVVSLPVVATFDDGLPGFDAPTHLVADTTIEEAQSGLLDTTLFVDVTDDATMQAVRAAVADTPGALFETRDGYVASAGSEIDAIRNLAYALLSLTAVIAVLGVANTTALSISERGRELGMLRAIGATRRGVRRVVAYEVAVLSAIGTVVGLAVAVFGGWAVVRTIGGTELGAVAVPLGTLAAIAAGSVMAGLSVAALPAWRASRRPTLDAIAGR